MPPPSANQQKVLIAQFVSLTGQTERQATRYLKNAGFKLNEAVDAYFASSGDSKGPSPLETKLDALFDQLQGTSFSETRRFLS
jgi:DCN1-like protein 1/2